MKDWTNTEHTFVVSDLHLTEAEPPRPKTPLWKKYKTAEFFIDETFKRFLEYIEKESEGTKELILNGDIFDFDSVMSLPVGKPYPISLVERFRGLLPEEAKSEFKLSVILQDHFVWVEAIKEFLRKGNRVVFIVGNHDMELYWPSVQQRLLSTLTPSEEFRDSIRICDWFYLSNQDTLIEHGHQYDDYCVCPNPINPLIHYRRKTVIRLPFGNLAEKYLINGLGLFNPHVDASFIKSGREYFIFFYRYLMRIQPFILFNLFIGASMTWFVSLREGLLPPLRDPLMVDTRIDDISQKSNATPRMTRALRALHVHPATFNPIKTARELWLDRAFLVLLIFFVSFQFFSFLNLFDAYSFWWFFGPSAILLPFVVYYSSKITSDVLKVDAIVTESAITSSQIAKVSRVIHGHTHFEKHKYIHDSATQERPVEVLNTGTWSPAFHDVECKKPFGKKVFAWIKPGDSNLRQAELHEWTGEDSLILKKIQST